MNFDYTPKVQELRKKLAAFMHQHVYPNEHKWHEHVKSEQRWQPVPLIEELKGEARKAGLWNLWRPKSHGGTLSNLEYAPLCEIMGRVHWAPEVFNCSAPDTGNMELLHLFRRVALECNRAAIGEGCLFAVDRLGEAERAAVVPVEQPHVARGRLVAHRFANTDRPEHCIVEFL